MPRGVPRSLQRRILYVALLSLATSTSTAAQDSDTIDCSKALDVDGVAYDLSSLAGERTVKRTRVTPPSTMEDELQFNMCQDLTHKDNVPEGDQCSAGTRACLTKTNTKAPEKSRIIAVIPIAQTSTLNPSYVNLQSSAGLSVTVHGTSYPPSESVPQSLNLTLLCTQDTSDPEFTAYKDGVMSVEWKTGAACPTSRNEDGSGGTGDGEEVEVPKSTGGSGIGWFFLLLLVSFLGYFALGAYYNYNNFGATGWDLVPHRDFWRDVPYLIRDFTEHLCSTLRPGRQGGSRRGYMAV